ncbi:hypothetical protein [Candidatus Formimonas warabiya]|uniref:Uncharacterized protein n=1 Tax=Formimonas warabiya TaxID=1761012 RepID=A0A3G1KZW1_FORW1|nr:hypothetical protein [Candidatus Formimonas warabiya]ATW27947.1 hypothetical protein DCMF_27185 [Candidatus Formimonas warabiya]
MAYAGKKALVKIPGTAVAFTDEATTTSDNKSYQITNTTKRVWHKTAAVTVEVNGTVTGEQYTLNRLNGTVTFSVANGSRGTVTVTGQYLPMSAAAEAHEWKLTMEAENLEVTPFQAVYRTKIQGLKGASGSISQWNVIDRYYYNALVGGNPLVLELYPQDTLTPLKIWAVLNSDELSAALDAAQDEAVSFESTEDLLI